MNNLVKEKLCDALGILCDGTDDAQYTEEDLKNMALAKITSNISTIKSCILINALITILGVVGAMLIFMNI